MSYASCIRLGNESSWGYYSGTLSLMQYPLSFEASVQDSKLEQDIIGTNRQSKLRTWLQREITGSLTSFFISPRLMYYALGSTTNDPTPPYSVTISGGSVLPSLTIERILHKSDETRCIGYFGSKIDRFDLNVSSKSGITQDIDLVIKDFQTIGTYNWNSIIGSSSWNDVFTYRNTCLKINNQSFRYNSFKLSIENNLKTLYAGYCSQEGIITTFGIREGSQDINGEISISDNFDELIRLLKDRNVSTISFDIGNNNAGTIQIVINNAIFEKFDDRVRGKDPYEIIFPFSCRSSTSDYNGIIVTYNSNIYSSVDQMPW